MTELQVKDKEIVVPGDIIAEGMDYLPGSGTYREEQKIIANTIGLLSVEGKVLKILNLKGPYKPKKGDKVIGKVDNILFSGWRTDVLNGMSAVLGVKDATSEFIQRGADLSSYFAIGDYIVAKITNVTSQGLIDITLRGPGLRKLKNGRMVQVNPAKVPRIIGKQGSMVQLIKEHTGVEITIGQNGLAHLDGTPEGEIKAVQTLKMIQEQAHLPGLTQRVTEFLKG